MFTMPAQSRATRPTVGTDEAQAATAAGGWWLGHVHHGHS